MTGRQDDDEWARGAFTFRRMHRWQIAALLAALVVLTIIYFLVL